MLTILIPMAGLGSRFQKSGYVNPKPLIDVAGQPMIKRVIENLTPSAPHRFIFICQNAHLEQYGLQPLLEKWASNAKVIGIDGLTEGAACTVLKAKEFINNDDMLIIANCDQYIEADMNEFVDETEAADGCIMTMFANDNKWSFARMDAEGFVQEVREKEVISNEATVGIYGFKHGRDFCEAAEEMIHANDRVNNEFYVAPVYNYLIRQGQKISVHNIGSLGKGMHGIGTPEDLTVFLDRKILQ